MISGFHYSLFDFDYMSVIMASFEKNESSAAITVALAEKQIREEADYNGSNSLQPPSKIPKIDSSNGYNNQSNLSCDLKGVSPVLDSQLKSRSSRRLLVACTNDKCNATVRHRNLPSHLSRCPKRIVKCEYCFTEGQYDTIIQGPHFKKCPEYPGLIKCNVTGCGISLARKEMALHACPKKVVFCEYSTVGCTARIKREEQEKHNDDFMKKHLQLAVNKVAEYARKQEEEVSSLECSHSQVIKIENSAKKEKILELSKVNDYVCEREYLRMTNYSRYKCWYSHDFYSFRGGYKMYMSISFNVDQNKKFLSCFIYFTKGSYDDTLEWPFQGEVTIELLNQLEDANHHVCLIHFDEEYQDKRPTHSFDTDGYGVMNFILCDDLNYSPTINCQYLKRDTLHFRVSVKAKCISQTPWLFY